MNIRNTNVKNSKGITLISLIITIIRSGGGKIGAAVYFTTYNCSGSFYLKGSNDRSNWTTLKTYTLPNGGSTFQRCTTMVGTSKRRISCI